jgi:hypothetical protein
LLNYRIASRTLFETFGAYQSGDASRLEAAKADYWLAVTVSKRFGLMLRCAARSPTNLV